MHSHRSSLVDIRSAARRLIATCAPVAAFASLLATPSDAHAIWSSYPIVDECQWATTIRMVSVGTSQYCTGVYLGNGVVVTAGHCVIDAGPHDELGGPPGAWVYFGEVTSPPNKAVVTVEVDCTTRPDFETFKCGLFGDSMCGTGPDLAYCVMRDIPPEIVAGFGVNPLVTGSVVRPMVPTGCERDWLQHRLYSESTEMLADAVGMGTIDKTPNSFEVGMKRHVQGQLVRQIKPDQDTTLSELGMAALEMYQPSPWDITKSLGDGERGQGPIRDGDSGGPLMVQLPDGTYRLIGVASATKGRNNYDKLGYWSHFVYYTPIPTYLRWIEVDSGIDVTPCHTWKDGWQFDEHCKAFDGGTTPEHTAWKSGCYDLDARTPVSACGVVPTEVPPNWVEAGTDFAKFGKTAGTQLDWQIHNALQDQRHLPSVRLLFEELTVDEKLGSRFDDTLIGTESDDLIRAGAGSDVLDAGAGHDMIDGGDGFDTIHAREGNDRIHPGTEQDFVDAGPGDDYVVVYHPCEYEAGEALVGGPGHDVLITPISEERMEKLGVFVDEFEEIVVTTFLKDAAWCSDPSEAPSW